MQMYKSMTAPEKDAEGNRIPLGSSLSRRFRRDERPSLSPRGGAAVRMRLLASSDIGQCCCACACVMAAAQCKRHVLQTPSANS